MKKSLNQNKMARIIATFNERKIEKEQSPIEWFNQQLEIERKEVGFITDFRYMELFKQAKEMNKKQNKTTTK